MIYKRIKCKVVYVLVLAMLLQIVGLPMSNYTHAETDNVTDYNLISLSGEVSELDIAEDTAEQASEEASEEEILEEASEEDATEESIEEIEEPVIDEENPQQNFLPNEAMEAKDLGNIFIFKSLKIDGEEIDGDSIIDISDGTKVTLEYDWDTEDLVVNPGDWAEIEVPNAFKLDREWKNLDIELSNGNIVGKYSLIDNILRFEFDEGINEAQGVINGYVGFGLNFNLEIFEKDIVQKIEFNDKSNKSITVIAKPTKEVTAIDKEGIPNSPKDAKEITWTIDIVNTNETTINDATVKDNIPEGLKLKDDSIKVYDLTVGLDGDKNPRDSVSVSPIVSENNFEINFDSIDPYKGYRIEYATTIEDYSIDSFTNDAALSYEDKNLPAESTVSGLDNRSDFIEKGGEYSGNDVIEWTIDVNKAGGRINQAIVEEDLPEGLTLISDSIEVYKLIRADSDWKEELDETKTYDKFPIDLGELGPEDSYRIKFKTSIDYSKVNDGSYVKENTFTNKVILKDGEKEIGDAKKEVKIARDPILRKEGKSNVNYGDKTLTWTVHVNEAHHPITGDAVITDILPKGLSITAGNIKIYDDEGNEMTLPEDAMTFTSQTNGTTEVKINLGEIGKEYRKIVYTTTIEDFSIDSFENGVSLSGGGVDGGGTIDPVPVVPPSNTYIKDHVGIDYNAKEMDWKITINPTREPIKELKIIDTFPNKGLILLEDTLKVTLGGTELIKGEDYTLIENTDEDGDTGYQKGFILEFNIDEEDPLNKEIVITYKTSYDPKDGVDANTDGNKWYVNNAKFEGKTKSGIDINTSDDDKKQVIDSSWNSGKKEGKLISIDDEGSIVNGWISGNERKIQWEVYINYLQQDLGKGISVEDELQYEGKIDIGDENSDEDKYKYNIEVKKYTVASDGNTTIGAILDKSNYDVFMDDEKSFILKFKDDFLVDERYVIIFTTSVPEISQGVYTNNAASKVGKKEYPYVGTVSFDKHDDFLSKKALVSGDKVYTDQELEWNIKINESLSIIEDAKIIDTISEGLVYKEGSLEIYKLEGTNRVKLEENKDYTLKVEPTEETILTIEFENTVDSIYEIEYTTIVIADKGQVNNNVEFSGNKIETKTVETKKLNAEQFSYVGGDPTKGKIEIAKVDEEGKIIASSKAKFKLWYEINDEDYLFGNQIFETTDGKIEIVNLPLNRTYYLEEVESPQGYVLSDKRIPIEVTKTAGSDNAGIYKEEVENKKIKGNIEFTKTDESNRALQEAVFGLYKGDVEITRSTSDENGKVLFENVEYGNYTIKEISAPEGYLLIDEVLNVTIGDNDNGVTVKPNKEVVENIIKKGNIEFNKVDESDRPLSGAKFGLYNSSGEKIAEATSAGENGVVKFENIPYGIYIIKEISAPTGYIESDVTLNVSIKDNGETVYPNEKSIENKKIIGDIEVKKLDEEDGTPLAGAIFVLEQNGVVNYTSEATDAHGRYVFKDIEYGKYTLKEKQPPKGYNPTDQSFEVEVKENGLLQSFEFENIKIKGSIRFRKLDESNKGLKGAEFTIYKFDDSSFAYPIASAISDKDGNVIFENIEYGEYRIKETKAPKGYNLSGKILDAKITTEGEVFIPLEYEISNIKIRGSIEILKRNRNTHNPLSNAKIGLYTDDDVLIEEKMTGKDGKVIFEDLEYGKYYFKEIESPSGYRLDNTKYYFDIEENGVILMRNLDNTRRNRPTDPDDPEEPEEPEKPVNPIEPGYPVDPTQPEQPVAPTNPGEPEVVTPPEDNIEEFEEVDTDIPAGGITVLPKTGEDSHILFYILGLVLIIVGLRYKKKTV
ncbi:LPXTG cell wall anchor domain-containing protein [Tissierella sp. Yu-01]|uniref:LPXTG cell wall anchor domain-containing protein n=1 Tax=Tissierella sp. Yu-01 TaxID=3035694 RepID=UPI00240E942D|nr:LPXTG cell wall anchor domain-containing protein [Tissierella sp. Yu-01]WFA08017.1 SpaA isopeptide-forming pilin-related protein [Tissierella sp. Yu-01]